MNVIKNPLEGVVIIEPRLFEDARGYFFESFNQREFDEKVCKTMAWSVPCICRNRPIRRASWCGW